MDVNHSSIRELARQPITHRVHSHKQRSKLWGRSHPCFSTKDTKRASSTFLHTAGLQKGLAWVNGHSLGRYWETEGPQHTLYVPAPYLKLGENEVLILELHPSRRLSSIKFVSAPDFQSKDHGGHQKIRGKKSRGWSASMKKRLKQLYLGPP